MLCERIAPWAIRLPIFSLGNFGGHANDLLSSTSLHFRPMRIARECLRRPTSPLQTKTWIEIAINGMTSNAEPAIGRVHIRMMGRSPRRWRRRCSRCAKFPMVMKLTTKNLTYNSLGRRRSCHGQSSSEIVADISLKPNAGLLRESKPCTTTSEQMGFYVKDVLRQQGSSPKSSRRVCVAIHEAKGDVGGEAEVKLARLKRPPTVHKI